jgi:hypothetical protein
MQCLHNATTCLEAEACNRHCGPRAMRQNRHAPCTTHPHKQMALSNKWQEGAQSRNALPATRNNQALVCQKIQKNTLLISDGGAAMAFSLHHKHGR